MNTLKIFFLLFLFQHLVNPVFSQLKQSESARELSGLSIDMQWFLSYLYSETEDDWHNEFKLKRGYVNIKKKINNKLSGRITTDITVDKEGDGEGDVEIRLKYLYLKYQFNTLGIFHKPYFEFGMVHRPWLDFEQSINRYRVQGRMFLERSGVISSADYGIFFHSLLGGEMDANYKKRINSKFAGKYGSFALGVFNGGGYHALEKNNNKTLESRVTIRPLYEIIPGLQLTWHGAIGKGNTEFSPDWSYSSGYVSYEHQHFILTTEYYSGKGNSAGSAILDTTSYEAVPQTGYSVFGEIKLFNNNISLIGRYDHFTQEYTGNDVITERAIAGIAYHFIGGSKILFNYDTVGYINSPRNRTQIFELAVEIKY